MMNHLPTIHRLDVPQPPSLPLKNPPSDVFAVPVPDNLEHHHQKAVYNNDEDDDNDNEVCAMKMEEFPLVFSEDITLHLIQAPTAFSGVEHDITGGVVWGASLCLANFLIQNPSLIATKDQPTSQTQSAASTTTMTTVLELGCGLGIPSMIASSLGASRVIATDFEDTTLQHLDHLAQINDCHNLELYKLDWKDDNKNHPLFQDEENDFEGANIILASDVIYSHNMVQPLVQTIDRFSTSSSEGKVYLALRDTREGVIEFCHHAMPNSGFVQVETIDCNEHGLLQDFNNIIGNNKHEEYNNGRHYINAADQHRFQGEHTIHVFQRRK